MVLVTGWIGVAQIASGSAWAAGGPLRVGADGPQPGFWNGTTTATLMGGFEYDLANDVATKLGRAGVKVVPIPFALLIAGRAKGFDLALEEALITRPKAPVEFSTPYLDFDVGILVRSGTTLTSLTSARTLRWGVATALPNPSTYLSRLVKPDNRAQTFADLAQAVAALEANQIDAVLDYTVSVLRQASLSHGRLVVVGQIRTADRLGAVLPKGSPLLKQVNAAIQALKADGTIDRLAAQYLGGDPSTVPFLRP